MVTYAIYLCQLIIVSFQIELLANTKSIIPGAYTENDFFLHPAINLYSRLNAGTARPASHWSRVSAGCPVFVAWTNSNWKSSIRCRRCWSRRPSPVHLSCHMAIIDLQLKRFAVFNSTVCRTRDAEATNMQQASSFAGHTRVLVQIQWRTSYLTKGRRSQYGMQCGD